MEPTNATTAERKRTNLVSEYFRRAYDESAKVVYVNALVPSELLLSFGAIPFNLGSVGGIFAQAKATPALINAGEQQHLSSDLCSTSRCLIGAAHQDALPTPELLVLTSGPCDVDSHLIHQLSRVYDRPWALLDVPLYPADEEQALRYVEGQLEQLVATLEAQLGVPFSAERLQAVIANTNATLEWVEKINALAACVPSPLSVVETIDIVSSLHLLGTPELVEIYREKYAELSARLEGRPPAKARRPRVLWHWLRPYYTNELFDHLHHGCGIDLLSEYDVMGIGFYGWERVDPERPLRSMARRLVRGAANYSLSTQDFVRQLPARAKEYALDGVISFSPRGCRHLVSLNHVLRDIFAGERLPLLEIDCDCIDDRDYAFSQLKTRLDAFAEMLHERMAS